MTHFPELTLELSMNLIVPDWPVSPARVGAVSTMRTGGASREPYDDGAGGCGLNLGAHVGDRLEDVDHNRALLWAILPAEPAWLTQVHGTVVLDAGQVRDVPSADATIATRPGVVCAILTADCLPVLFSDIEGRVVGAAHAGWRGLAGGVLQNTVTRMREAGAGEIIAWLGPAIGPRQFEVGGDVVAAFSAMHAESAAAFMSISERPGKYLADIYRLAHLALARCDVTRIHGGGLCTVTDAQCFYSYRRDRNTGRMASLIWIK